MTEQFLEEYFSDIAVRLTELQHTKDRPAFYRIEDQYDLDEFDNAVRSMAKNACLLLELGEGDLGEWDTPTDRPRIGLHVLVKVDDKSKRKLARDQSKEILCKIVSIIRRDAKDIVDGNQVTEGPLRAQRIVFESRIKIGNMSAVDGNWYGKSFYFDFSGPIDLQYHNTWEI